MHTSLLTITLGLALLAQTPAQQPKEDKATLKIGDAAPAFRADKWLQGSPVASLQRDTIYVVEFWATWCGPCVTMMPHLADLADEYKDKGVVVIGFSSAAQDKLDKAEQFLGQRGPKLGYRFAWGDTDAMHKTWMEAAGQGGIPCSFVVGKGGKLAYIGHPLFLDLVLPRVLDGSWDAAKGMAEIEAADKDFDRAYAVSGTNDPVAGLKTLEAVVAAHPTFAGCSYLLGPTLELLIKNDRAAEARAIAEKAVAKAVGRGDVVALRTVRSALLIDAARKETSLAAIAVKAAELDRELTGADDAGATVRLAGAYAAAGDAAKAAVLGAEGVALAEKAVKGDKDWQGLLLLASAHDAAGDKAKAKAAAEKAVAAVGDQGGLKEHVASQAKKYGVEGKAPAGPK